MPTQGLWDKPISFPVFWTRNSKMHFLFGLMISPGLELTSAADETLAGLLPSWSSQSASHPLIFILGSAEHLQDVDGPVVTAAIGLAGTLLVPSRLLGPPCLLFYNTSGRETGFRKTSLDTTWSMKSPGARLLRKRKERRRTQIQIQYKRRASVTSSWDYVTHCFTSSCTVMPTDGVSLLGKKYGISSSTGGSSELKKMKLFFSFLKTLRLIQVPGRVHFQMDMPARQRQAAELRSPLCKFCTNTDLPKRERTFLRREVSGNLQRFPLFSS